MLENDINLANAKDSFLNYENLNIIGDGVFSRRVLELVEDLYPHLKVRLISKNEDHTIKNSPKTCFLLGLGFTNLERRKEILEQDIFPWNPVLVSPNFERSKSAMLGTGSVILGVGSLGMNVSLGRFNVIFSGAIVEPEVKTGKNVLIGPGAVICRSVEIGDNVRIGAGAIILPSVKVDSDSTIGAGALIRTSVASFERIVGVPGRRLD